ncbi:MAG TPA: DUF2073 domain-containing protein [Candidatus Aenigmarchaeota archaeon]|nr:DUF2073 domain-containing protein [Candidatus Aenigmarchaeota archaeon]
MKDKEKHMGLKIKVIPYEKMKEQRFNGLVKDLQQNTIVMIDAKLTAKEEAQIIAETMRKVSDKFSGIELGSLDISSEENLGNLGKIKNAIIERITGKKRGITIIGPARIIHKIKKNPKELLVHI